eukprot:2814806-Pyramimonas_sp.AAC.1
MARVASMPASDCLHLSTAISLLTNAWWWPGEGRAGQESVKQVDRSSWNKWHEQTSRQENCMMDGGRS